MLASDGVVADVSRIYFRITVCVGSRDAGDRDRFKVYSCLGVEKKFPGAVDLTWETCDSGAGSLDAEVSILWVVAGVQGGFWRPKVASCSILVVILYLSRRVDSVGLDLDHSLMGVVSSWILD
ncbi:hypothetical protein ABFC53_01450 [Stenotrophomonas pavanii]|uniref:hypothetical protein n=1 Tax=Stenotrophomonas pavanii TaxID=487698 RepID=UPI0011AFA307|nr:hypothetical protein [Stenotrophomonas pavanii]